LEHFFESEKGGFEVWKAVARKFPIDEFDSKLNHTHTHTEERASMCAALLHASDASLLCCAENSDSLDNLEESPSHSRGSAAVQETSDGNDVFSNQQDERDFGDHAGFFQGEGSADYREVLLAMEAKEKDFMPCWEKVDAQGEGMLEHRSRVVTCMQDLCRKLRFGDSTFFAAVNLLDRFLSVHAVKDDLRVLFPLIGIACVSIAAKMAEVHIPSLRSLQALMGPNLPFNAQHIQRTEMGILSSLGWAVNCITPYTVLAYVVKQKCAERPDREGLALAVFQEAVQQLRTSVLGKEYLVRSATESARACVALAFEGALEANAQQRQANDDGAIKRNREGFETGAYPNKRARSPTTPLCSQWLF